MFTKYYDGIMSKEKKYIMIRPSREWWEKFTQITCSTSYITKLKSKHKATTVITMSSSARESVGYSLQGRIPQQIHNEITSKFLCVFSIGKCIIYLSMFLCWRFGVHCEKEGLIWP
jgi:hypothetical protein